VDQVESGACDDCGCEPTGECALPFACPGQALPQYFCVAFTDRVTSDVITATLFCVSGAGWYWLGDVDNPLWDSIHLFDRSNGHPVLEWINDTGCLGAGGTGYYVTEYQFNNPYGLPVWTCSPLQINWAGDSYQPAAGQFCPTYQYDIEITEGACVAPTLRGCHRLAVCSDADLPDRLCVTLTHVVCSPGVGEGTYQGVVTRSRCTWSGTAGRVAGTGPAFVGVRLDLVGSHFTAKLSTSRCCAAGDIGVYSTDDSAFHTQVPYTLTCSPFSIIWDQAALANVGDVSCSNLSVKVYVTPVPCATVVEIETEFGTGT
jgi:hypothetical protein